MVEEQLSPSTDAIFETAAGEHSIGRREDATYEKITLRHLPHGQLYFADPIGGDEIRYLRQQANLSQAAFARFLNLTTGYVSQLERGVKKPSGPALTLLNVLRRKGFAAIL